MGQHKLRKRLGGLASFGALALTAAMILGAGTASASTIPAYPTTGVAPNWYTTGGTNNAGSASNIVRDSGSDTTIFMMQQIGDLYTGAGLYGCQLVASGSEENVQCDNQTGTSPDYSDIATTDTTDNFDRTEIDTGVNDVGSTAGQKQLCGSAVLASPQVVDFARSSKPANTSYCSGLVGLGYAKDGVPAVDFPTINPAAVGTAGSDYAGQTFSWDGESTPQFPVNGNGVAGPNGVNTSSNIGPVAAGWLPGDPTSCAQTNTCSGVAFNDVDNEISGTLSTSSVAYRLWCASDTTRIYDWGQLTNLNANGPGNGGVAKTVGNGAPIGVPIRIVGVNPNSGTNSTFASFANSGGSSANSANSNILSDGNAASGPNPLVSNGVTGNNEIALENNASQIGDFAASDFPNDPADEAVEIATSLYFMSYGVWFTNDYANTATLEPGTGTVPAGVPTAYTANTLSENGVSLSNPHIKSNAYPTARDLWNVYNTATVRASAAGFLNWICDTNPASTGSAVGNPLTGGHGGQIAKGKDNSTGLNFDAELQNIISNNFGFQRLTDVTPELSTTAQTPADGVFAPNASCDAEIPITSTGGTTVTDTAGSLPPGITAGLAVTGASGAGVPSSTTVSSVSGATLTLNNAIPATVTTLYFPGVAPVLAVHDPTS